VRRQHGQRVLHCSCIANKVLCILLRCRYMDEVRKVIKTCYEEVWTILQEHRYGAV
jgi:hypothetical protein